MRIRFKILLESCPRQIGKQVRKGIFPFKDVRRRIPAYHAFKITVTAGISQFAVKRTAEFLPQSGFRFSQGSKFRIACYALLAHAHQRLDDVIFAFKFSTAYFVLLQLRQLRLRIFQAFLHGTQFGILLDKAVQGSLVGGGGLLVTGI